MTQTHPDQKYIDALLRNDRRLLEEIYNKYAGKIQNMVLRNNGTGSDAADLFQEALMAIYQRAVNGTFVLTCPLEAYLYLICRNRWINELGRQRKKVTFTDTEGYTYGEDVFSNAEKTANGYERRKLLEEKFSELGDRCRQLLTLSWGGKPMEEVARLMDNTYGYIRKKKSECMARLAELVKNSPQFANLQW
ncbi:MAG: RNA polymerase sigma factor [Chitinophagaceae bacterium]